MKVFPSVSFHITKPCNMSCKFCYSTYEELGKVKMIAIDDAMTILEKLAAAGVSKVTFAGGEPMLHPNLDSMISYAKKELGMTTSLITNGSLLTEARLRSWYNQGQMLDWVGLSIDSFDHRINQKIGRVVKDQDMATQYLYLLRLLNELNYKVKVNTVINKHNYKDFSGTITSLNMFKIDRFKILRTLPIAGENQEGWNEIACTDEMWASVQRTLNLYYELTDSEDSKVKRNIKTIVPEDNEAMTASYLLISPKGELYENSKGEHTFGPNLIQHSMEECMKGLDFNYDTFVQRGGLYEW